MHDHPYTTPEEDPFNVRHVVQVCPRPCKSDLFDKWIQEQQCFTDTSGFGGSPSSRLSHLYFAFNGPETEGQPTPESNLPVDLNNITNNAPSTVRSSRCRPRTSAGHSNTQSKFGESNVPSLSRFSLFSKSSGRTFIGCTTTTQKLSRHASHISPSRKDSQVKARASAASSEWPSPVLRHLGSVELVAPATSQVSLQPPSSDSTHTPFRLSSSSSFDASHTDTSLTVPSIEITPSVVPLLSRPHFHNHPTVSSSPSVLQPIHPENIMTHIQEVSTMPILGESEQKTGHHIRIDPLVYDNGIKSQAHGIPLINAFNGIISTWRSRSTSSNAGVGVEHDLDDVEELATHGSDRSHVPQTYALSSNQQHQYPHPQQVHQNQSLEHGMKKKVDVVYASAGPHSSSGGTLSKMASFYLAHLSTMSMRNKQKKKRLILSGIEIDDTKKFTGVKRWCESFGEVRQILRMPNGDLVISFQSAEVADTVCRIRASVFIMGVGSVQMSWTTEKE